MAQLEARTSEESGRCVVSLSGEADLSVRDQLTGALLAAVSAAPVVMVDLAGLTFLDSSGLHGLVTAYHAARQDGSELYVVNATGAVADLLDLTGIADLLRPPAADGRTSDV